MFIFSSLENYFEIINMFLALNQTTLEFDLSSKHNYKNKCITITSIFFHLYPMYIPTRSPAVPH